VVCRFQLPYVSLKASGNGSQAKLPL
jgi:hypothetical protein